MLRERTRLSRSTRSSGSAPCAPPRCSPARMRPTASATRSSAGWPAWLRSALGADVKDTPRGATACARGGVAGWQAACAPMAAGGLYSRPGRVEAPRSSCRVGAPLPLSVQLHARSQRRSSVLDSSRQITSAKSSASGPNGAKRGSTLGGTGRTGVESGMPQVSKMM